MVDEQSWSEAKIQQTAISYIRNTYPESYACIWHVANGGIRDPRTASILTGQGVVPGIADLNLFWKGKIYMIEIKTINGTVSLDQKVVHSKHKMHGLDTYIFTTSDQIINFVECVIKDRNIQEFNHFISPFSVADKYEVYLNELRDFRINKLKNK